MSAGRTAALVFLWLLPSIAFGQDNLAERGLALFKEGKYQAALERFQNASHVQPDSPMLENLIGITETKLNRIQQANAAYEKAIDLNPEFAPAHKNLGFNYLNAKQYAQAEVELSKASSLDETDPFAHYYLAVTYLKTSRDTDAIGQMKPAEPLIENDPDTAYLMATACLRANSSDWAIKIIDAVQKRSAFSVEQQFELATLLSDRQMYPEAIRLFEDMVSSDPGSWVAKYNLAVALFEANRPGEGIPLVEQVSKQRPEDGRVFDLLGALYESSSKLPEALDAYQTAVAAAPENTDYYLDYTRLLMDLDRYDDAATLVERGIQNSHDTYALNVRLGAIDLMRGKLDEAVDSFQKAIKEHPEIPIGYVALAKAYTKQGKDQTAANMLADARRKTAEDFALEYVYGLVSARLGNSQDALDALKHAENMDPTAVDPHYQLGKLYMGEGSWTLAQDEFERVVASKPSYAQAYYQLSKVYSRLGNVQKAHEMQAEAKQLMNDQRDAALAAQRQRQGAFRPR